MALFNSVRNIFQGLNPAAGAQFGLGGGAPPTPNPMQDWRSQRPQFDPAMSMPAFQQSMQDWRGQRPARPMGVAGTGVPAPGATPAVPQAPVAPVVPQKNFASGLMSSIGKYMPPGWGM